MHESMFTRATGLPPESPIRIALVTAALAFVR